MKKLWVHLLSLLLLCLPVANVAYALEDDDAMAMEEDLFGSEDVTADDSLGADEELAGDDLLGSEEVAEDDLFGSDDAGGEELFASADAGEDDLFGSDASDDDTISFGGSGSSSDEDDFPVAYANIDDMEIYDPAQYREQRGEYGYYTSGTRLTNYFRVNENNEESTDETIGILFFAVALPGIVYNNLFGWWH